MAKKTSPKKAATKRKAQQAKRPQNVNLNNMFISSEVTADGMDHKKPYQGKGAVPEMSKLAARPCWHNDHNRVCTCYYDNKKTYPKTLDAEIKSNIAKIEKVMGEIW